MYKIHDTVKKQRHLKLVETNVYKIPERLNEYDNSLHILRNKTKNTYELHSTDNKWGGTYCLTIPFDSLDSRTIELVRRGDMAVRPKQWELEVTDKINKSEEHVAQEVIEKKAEAIDRMHFAVRKLAKELII